MGCLGGFEGHFLRAGQVQDCLAAGTALRLAPFGLIPLLPFSGSCSHLPQAPSSLFPFVLFLHLLYFA